MTTAERSRIEWLKCTLSVIYFTVTYVWIENATLRSWVNFVLWPAQAEVLEKLVTEKKLLILKARQLGISWLVLTYLLWLIVFQPPTTVLIFSKGEKEAKELLDRLKKMYERLPDWMHAKRIDVDNGERFELSTGSKALAFTTGGGRSFTGSVLLFDEFDFVEDQQGILDAAEPTIDAGGQMIVITTSDKDRPQTAFKNMFLAAFSGLIDYCAIFLPWSARPERTQSWYEALKSKYWHRDGNYDSLYAEYPESPEQALAANTANVRFPVTWLGYLAEHKIEPISTNEITIPELVIWQLPKPGRNYVIGADPAEGNPNSDDSAFTIFDDLTWEEVASYAAKREPGAFADDIITAGLYYNKASVMVERNNHGHTVINNLVDDGQLTVLTGLDSKLGWLTNEKGKQIAVDATAKVLKDQSLILHDQETKLQIVSIQADTLKAPPGMHDDRASSVYMGVVGLKFRNVSPDASTVIPAADPLVTYDKGGY